MRRRTFIGAVATATAAPVLARTQSTQETTGPTTGYVEVNGLNMYYESHGAGDAPLVRSARHQCEIHRRRLAEGFGFGVGLVEIRVTINERQGIRR